VVTSPDRVTAPSFVAGARFFVPGVSIGRDGERVKRGRGARIDGMIGWGGEGEGEGEGEGGVMGNESFSSVALVALTRLCS
jgi:hypothetical protein